MITKQINAEDIYLAQETNNTEDQSVADGDLYETMAIANDLSATTNKSEKIFRVNEILELRDSIRKVYRMSDGSMQAVFYPETVHVLDRDKQLFDTVDADFVEEADGKHYVNGKNNFTARFNRDIENDELFMIENGMHRVTVLTKKNKKQRTRGIMPRVKKIAVSGAENKNSLVFEAIQDGADYEYSIIGDGIKENIVIKNRSDVYRYSFILHLENVTAEFDETNKRIAFLSNESRKEVFYIPAPFMVDADGIISNSVFYEVKGLDNGDIAFAISADSEWINQDSRKFPITIDPQIQLSGTSSMSTYSWTSGQLYNGTQHTIGTTGTGDGDCNAKRMYISLNMPSLPRNPRIKKAEIIFTQQACESEGDYPQFGLYRVNGEICIGNCTPISDANLIDYAKLLTDSNITYSFDVTTLIDQINKGEISTQNLVMKMLDEDNTCNNSITLYGS